MEKLAAAEIVVPHLMTQDARQRLVDDLYTVHCRIFEGVDRRSFAKYVVESSAEHTWIQLHKSARGEVVGYIAIHIFERELRGETAAVMRAEAGMMSEYRGANVNGWFALDRLIRYMLAHPGRPTYYLGSLVHPSSYAQIARYADNVYPNPSEAPPAEVAELMGDLAATFGISPVAEGNPLVCKVGWRTIDTDADRAHWRRTENPYVRFFMAENPGYTEGHGLLTVAPLSLAGVMRAGGRFVGSKARRWARGVAAAWAPRPTTSAA